MPGSSSISWQGSTTTVKGSTSTCQRTAAGIVRRLIEHRLPELVMTGVAGDSDVSHAAAALGSFASWTRAIGLPYLQVHWRSALALVRAAGVTIAADRRWPPAESGVASYRVQ